MLAFFWQVRVLFVFSFLFPSFPFLLHLLSLLNPEEAVAVTYPFSHYPIALCEFFRFIVFIFL